MIEVEVLGSALAPDAPPLPEIQRLCSEAAARFHVDDGHLAIEFVDAQRIGELNAAHRERPRPTDVLSFPIDGAEPLEPAAPTAQTAATGSAGTATSQPAAAAALRLPRELGDIVICPEHTRDLREAIVHGMLHLLGMDHERDEGQMLTLQHELLSGPRR